MPFLPFGIPDEHRYRATERPSEPNPAEDLEFIAFEAHARPTAETELAPR
jgi:hypothetical protein